MVRIVPITEKYIHGFHVALDSVCRERKYLARFEAPPIDSVRKFVLANIERGVPQYVALVDEAVVGWCDISLSNKPVFKHVGSLGIGVISNYRNKGIGTELMKATLQKAMEIGIERVELEVFETNTAAVNLYKKIGFVVEGRKMKSTKIDGIYHDDLIMALFLDKDSIA